MLRKINIFAVTVGLKLRIGKKIREDQERRVREIGGNKKSIVSPKSRE